VLAYAHVHYLLRRRTQPSPTVGGNQASALTTLPAAASELLTWEALQVGGFPRREFGVHD